MTDYYSELGEGYRNLHWAEQADKLGILSLMVNAKEDELLLDVGCGPSWARKFFHCKYYGIDPAAEQVKNEENCVVGAGEDLPFPDEHFDIVICVTALHNFDDPIKGLDEIERVCKDNGRIGITILKKSEKANELSELISQKFVIVQRVEQSQDSIILCKPK